MPQIITDPHVWGHDCNIYCMGEDHAEVIWLRPNYAAGFRLDDPAVLAALAADIRVLGICPVSLRLAEVNSPSEEAVYFCPDGATDWQGREAFLMRFRYTKEAPVLGITE
jgi:hypothetical protein